MVSSSNPLVHENLQGGRSLKVWFYSHGTVWILDSLSGLSKHIPPSLEHSNAKMLVSALTLLQRRAKVCRYKDLVYCYQLGGNPISPITFIYEWQICLTKLVVYAKTY